MEVGQVKDASFFKSFSESFSVELLSQPKYFTWFITADAGIPLAWMIPAEI